MSLVDVELVADCRSLTAELKAVLVDSVAEL